MSDAPVDEGVLWRMFGTAMAGAGRGLKYQCRFCGRIVGAGDRAAHEPTHRSSGGLPRKSHLSEHERAVRRLTKRRRKKKGRSPRFVGSGHTRKVGSHRDGRGHR